MNSTLSHFRRILKPSNLLLVLPDSNGGLLFNASRRQWQSCIKWAYNITGLPTAEETGESWAVFLMLCCVLDWRCDKDPMADSRLCSLPPAQSRDQHVISPSTLVGALTIVLEQFHWCRRKRRQTEIWQKSSKRKKKEEKKPDLFPAYSVANFSYCLFQCQNLSLFSYSTQHQTVWWYSWQKLWRGKNETLSNCYRVELRSTSLSLGTSVFIFSQTVSM